MATPTELRGKQLYPFQRAAIEAIGVEISESSRDEARERYDVDVLLGDLIHSELPIEDHYDVVVMNHVLEHLVTPLNYLKRVHELLGPNGLLAIEIPQQFINPIDLVYRCLGKNRRFGASVAQTAVEVG